MMLNQRQAEKLAKPENMDMAGNSQEMEESEKLENIVRKCNKQATSSTASWSWGGGSYGGHAWSGRSTTMTPAAPGTGIRRRPPIGSSAEAIRLLRHFTRQCGENILSLVVVSKKDKEKQETPRP